MSRPSYSRLSQQALSSESSPGASLYAGMGPNSPSATSDDNSSTLLGESKNQPESMDFDEIESVMWRKHQLRRFFHDRDLVWTSARRTTMWKWALVIVIGVLVGLCGVFVQIVTEDLVNWKFNIATRFIDENRWAEAFFSYVFISVFLICGTAVLCWYVPQAAGSGIAELKGFLNGISLDSFVQLRVLFAKVLGVCFNVASGLPLGKEGPMIHIGAITGAVVSQGKTILFGHDTSWTKFQDFRSDRSKRDFVTYGAAAGIAAAFRAPIGGILFTLEEGASFWSTSLTFRAFFCAMVSMLTVSILFAGKSLGRGESESIFSFGEFDNIDDGKTNYRTYELIIFIFIGALGGFFGAVFNQIHIRATQLRSVYIDDEKWRRVAELLIFTFVMALISFVLPIMWPQCTVVPSDVNGDFTSQEKSLLKDLVSFQCKDGEYNELASLYFTSTDIALRQLFHFREYEGEGNSSFTSGPLLLFFLTYFLMAACSAGLFAPAGLFVPILVSGAALGRLIGHILNSTLAGYVADSGTYALIGAAAMLGGMTRMTISGTVIILEAAGNMAYLLPLMVTFGAARYVGNAVNMGIYEINMLDIQKLPFLPGALNNIGLLTFFPITEIMIRPVVCFNEIEKVSRIYEILSTTKHNGFPVLGNNGHLVGLILRKTLCSLLKLKAFSAPQQQAGASSTFAAGTNVTKPWGGHVRNSGAALGNAALGQQQDSHEAPADGVAAGGPKAIHLSAAGTIFYDNLERSYPRYPQIEEISLTAQESNLWLDLRPYMDTAPYSINQSASVQRCYRQFRSMGLRHLVVVDSDHKVVGMITRKDLTQRRLDKLWQDEGQHLQKFISVDPLPPAIVYEDESSASGSVAEPTLRRPAFPSMPSSFDRPGVLGYSSTYRPPGDGTSIQMASLSPKATNASSNYTDMSDDLESSSDPLTRYSNQL